jgi:hypothetical protein
VKSIARRLATRARRSNDCVSRRTNDDARDMVGLYLSFAIANGPETCFEEITPDKS